MSAAPKNKITSITFSPHHGQASILQAIDRGAKRLAVCCGRRFGKSYLARWLILIEALKPNKRIAYVCPKYSYGIELFNHLRSQLEEWKVIAKRAGVSSANMTLRTSTGSVIQIFSADGNKDATRGDSWDLIIMDEAARIKDLGYIVNNSALPTLTEKNGVLLLISTPQASTGAFYKIYADWKKEMESGDKVYFCFHGSSELNSYVQGWDKIRKEMMDRSPDSVAVELDAIPSADAGLVFGDITSQIIDEPTDNAVIAYGLDLGITQDYTVLTGINAKREVIQVDRFKAENWIIAESKIKMHLGNNYHIPIFADRTGVGAPVCDHLAFDGYNIQDIVWTGQNKPAMVSILQRDIKRMKFLRFVVEELKKELEQYEYAISETGKLSFGAPSGLHDDCVSSLIMVNYGLHKDTVLAEGLRDPGQILFAERKRLNTSDGTYLQHFGSQQRYDTATGEVVSVESNIRYF